MVKLELTNEQALVLLDVTDRIGGSPERSPRGHIDAIAEKLSKAGVVDRPTFGYEPEANAILYKHGFGNLKIKAEALPADKPVFDNLKVGDEVRLNNNNPTPRKIVGITDDYLFVTPAYTAGHVYLYDRATGEYTGDRSTHLLPRRTPLDDLVERIVKHESPASRLAIAAAKEGSVRCETIATFRTILGTSVELATQVYDHFNKKDC